MWFICAMFSTLFWGFAEIFYKKAADPKIQYTHLRTCIWVGCVMGLHALFVLQTQNINYDPINLIKYLPVSLMYIISMACAYFGVRRIEVSISSPIENTSGAICTLLCVIFLKTILDFSSTIAIILIATGILGISFLENNGETNRSKKIGKTIAILSFAMPFIYAILDAVASFLDIYFLNIETSPLIGINEDNIELIANTSYELTFFICAIFLFIFLQFKKNDFQFFKDKTNIAAALCETAGQFFYVYAMSGNGAIAAPIISSTCIVPLILSKIILKEKLTLQQYFFIFLIIIGIMWLAIIEQ